MMKAAKKIIGYGVITVGLLLTVINLYGLTQNIRPDGLFTDDLRFEDDIRYSYQEALALSQKKTDESDEAYLYRLAFDISRSLAHIHWKDETDTTRYHQLIPIWENYFIYFMGLFSGIPEYEKYHFSNYRRSLERGIGNCGDASMITSQILEQYNIDNKIVSFPGHVAVMATLANGETYLVDSDFGVTIPTDVATLNANPGIAGQYYKDGGYTVIDAIRMKEIYGGRYKLWDGTSHFITKKYYFEILAYWLKWPLPIVMIILGLVLIRNRTGVKQ